MTSSKNGPSLDCQADQANGKDAKRFAHGRSASDGKRGGASVLQSIIVRPAFFAKFERRR